MASKINSTFSRVFAFSIILTLLISLCALAAFRYFAGQYTAPYQAQSMIAKYQLVEQNYLNKDRSFLFGYRVEESPGFSPDKLPYYFEKVQNEIALMLGDHVSLNHSEVGGDMYLWFKPQQVKQKWIGIQLSHKNPLILYYGWAYIAVVLLGSILPVYYFARTISRPVAVLSQAANEMAAGSVPNIQARGWSNEIRALAKALTTASYKLKDQTKSKENMLLGISHDLRTPLTRARLAVDFLEPYDHELVTGVIEDLDEMDQIIDQFIVFAREGRFENKEATAICQLVKEVAEKFKQVRLTLAPEFEACVSPLSVKRLVSNLLSNAVKYGEPPIDVIVEKSAGRWSITVIDSGCGIPPDKITEMIKPFTTLDNAGTAGKGGLGLAIVDRIAKHHHGSIHFFHTSNQRFAVKASFEFQDMSSLKY